MITQFNQIFKITKNKSKNMLLWLMTKSNCKVQHLSGIFSLIIKYFKKKLVQKDNPKLAYRE